MLVYQSLAPYKYSYFTDYVTSAIFDTTGKEIIVTDVHIVWDILNEQEVHIFC